jgi:hypothetical protein
LFPGRTLEELDNIDWFRLKRALEVKEIGEIEQTYLGYKQGIVKSTSITSKQWEKITEHDQLIEKYDDNLI